MLRISSLVVALAGAALAAGCSSPMSQLAPSPQGPAWRDTGTPTPPIAIDRLARYYVDENGALWDDRGRKYEGAP
jgi:hypothetical protein